jgi:branched-chain amino acid transport system substrate-binding protein
VAGPYLVKIKFFSTIFAPAESPKFTDFVNRFKAKTGEAPVADAVNAYDCVWLFGLAILQAGKYDGEAIRNTLPAVAKTYFGASGWTFLDENGDKASGNYDMWAVVLKDGKPSWERVALVDTGTDSVKWFRRI